MSESKSAGDQKAKRAKVKRYPGSLVRRGQTFILNISVGGKRHFYTIPTTDKRAAEKFAIERSAELRRGEERRRRGLPTAISVSELLALFESQKMPTFTIGTQAAYEDSLKVIRKYFVGQLLDPPIDHVHAKHVSGFLAWRRVNSFEKGATTVSNRTLQKDRAVLHTLFALADRLEYRDGNPVRRVQAPKADTRNPVILSAAEYERLIKACSGKPMLELYVLCLGEAGLRCESEALWLQWPDVDLDGGFLTIASGRGGHRTKSGRDRHVPMTQRLRSALREHFANHRFASYHGERPVWVFHHPVTQGKRQSGKRVGSMRDGFTSASLRAKLPDGLHQHDLRHRRVTTWLAEGKDVVKVKEAMGHSDLRTTMGYMHLVKENLLSLVESPASVIDIRAG